MFLLLNEFLMIIILLSVFTAIRAKSELINFNFKLIAQFFPVWNRVPDVEAATHSLFCPSIRIIFFFFKSPHYYLLNSLHWFVASNGKYAAETFGDRNTGESPGFLYTFTLAGNRNSAVAPN